MKDKLSCLSCDHFRSYEYLYEDPLEPWDCGECGHPANHKTGIGEDDICELHPEYKK